MDYQTIGARAQKDLANWHNEAKRFGATFADSHLWCHDLDAFPEFETMTAPQFGYLISLATASRLNRLGYSGARSENGLSAIPLFTAGLYQLMKTHGKNSVIRAFLDSETGELRSSGWRTGIGMRGVRDTIEIRLAFSQHMNKVIRDLLLDAAVSN